MSQRLRSARPAAASSAEPRFIISSETGYKTRAVGRDAPYLVRCIKELRPLSDADFLTCLAQYAHFTPRRWVSAVRQSLILHGPDVYWLMELGMPVGLVITRCSPVGPLQWVPVAALDIDRVADHDPQYSLIFDAWDAMTVYVEGAAEVWEDASPADEAAVAAALAHVTALCEQFDRAAPLDPDAVDADVPGQAWFDWCCPPALARPSRRACSLCVAAASCCYCTAVACADLCVECCCCCCTSQGGRAALIKSRHLTALETLAGTLVTVPLQEEEQQQPARPLGRASDAAGPGAEELPVASAGSSLRRAAQGRRASARDSSRGSTSK